GVHGIKDAFHFFRCGSHKPAAGSQIKIVEHPAGNHRVEHHQQIVARHGDDSVEMPFLPRFFQLLTGFHSASAAGSSHGKLHGQNGDSQNDQEEYVEQHKKPSAVLTSDVRKTPDISDADGAAGGDQHKPQPGREFFSFHCFLSLIAAFVLPPERHHFRV